MNSNNRNRNADVIRQVQLDLESPFKQDIFTAPEPVAMVPPATASMFSAPSISKEAAEAKLAAFHKEFEEKIMKQQRIQMFCYGGVPYMRIVPSKKLFNSTMVHEVVTRGDFFACNMQTGVFTVLPNGADKQ